MIRALAALVLRDLRLATRVGGGFALGLVFYLSLIYWTYADARRRIHDPMLIACSTAASLFPFVGTIV